MSFISFLCFNVHGLQVNKLDQLKRCLIENQLDFIIVQETWFLNTEDDCIVFHSNPAEETNSVRQNGGIAVITTPWNKDFTLLYSSENLLFFLYKNTYILTSYFPPSLEDDDILAILEDIPAHSPHFFIGDFNFKFRFNNSKESLRPSRKNLLDAFAETISCYWRKPQYESSNESSNNDHCYSHRSIQPLIKLVSREKLGVISDHDALWVQHFFEETSLVEFADMDQRTFRFHIKKLDHDHYRNILKGYYDTYSWLHQVDSYLASFRTDIENKVLSRTQLEWMLEDISQLISKCMWSAAKDTLGMYEVSEAKMGRRSDPNDMNPSSQTDARLLFKRAQRSNRSVIEPLVTDGNALDDAYRKFYDLFTVTDEPLPATGDEVELFYAELEMKVLRKVIKSYPGDKSCGIDGLHTNIFKSLLGSTLPRHLLLLYKICLRTGCTPMNWNSTLMHLIPKKPGNVNVQDTRPISLTCMQRRFFEMCLMRRLKATDNPLLKTHGSQCSGKPGYSCLSHALVGDEILKKGKKYSVLVDFKKAFDSVNWLKLQDSIRKKNCGSQLESLIESLFMKRPRMKLVVNGQRSKEVFMKRGILQGSVLSPALFNLYIDSLLRRLNDFGSSLSTGVVTALGYADDIRLFASSKEDLQMLLTIVDEWSLEMKIEVNLSKTFLLSDSSLPSGLFLYGEQIPIKKQDLYLGIETTAAGSNWYDFLKTRILKTKKMLNFIGVIGSNWTPAIKVNIFKTMIRPVLEYCAPASSIWLSYSSSKTKELKQDLAALDKEILGFIFGLKRSFNMLHWMSLVEPSTVRLNNLRILAFNHFGSLNTQHPAQLMLPLVKNKSKSILSELVIKPAEWTLWLNAGGASKVSKSRFLVLRWKKSLKDLDQALISYTLDQGRLSEFSVDGWMASKDQVLRSFCLGWRTGSLWMTRTCPRCKQKFNRRCFIDCEWASTIFNEFFDAADSYDDWLDFCSRINGYYTFLDQVLNNQDYELALKTFKYLNGKMIKS